MIEPFRHLFQLKLILLVPKTQKVSGYPLKETTSSLRSQYKLYDQVWWEREMCGLGRYIVAWLLDDLNERTTYTRTHVPVWTKRPREGSNLQ